MNKAEMNEWLLGHDETMTVANYARNKYGEIPDLVILNDMAVEAIIENRMGW